jgi:hypothetical protein
VAVIFNDLIKTYIATVQPIAGTILDDWSWADRKVRDSETQVSNHASATAIDLNALQYPRGTTHMTPGRVAMVHKMLKKYDGVIRWGGDYVNAPKDQMHFEIDANKTEVHALALKLKPKPTPEDDDMPKWTDKVALTATDASVWNETLAKGQTPYKEGDLVTFSDMVRYPTLARKTDLKVDRILALLNTEASQKKVN